MFLRAVVWCWRGGALFLALRRAVAVQAKYGEGGKYVDLKVRAEGGKGSHGGRWGKDLGEEVWEGRRTSGGWRGKAG